MDIEITSDPRADEQNMIWVELQGLASDQIFDGYISRSCGQPIHEEPAFSVKSDAVGDAIHMAGLGGFSFEYIRELLQREADSIQLYDSQKNESLCCKISDSEPEWQNGGDLDGKPDTLDIDFKREPDTVCDDTKYGLDKEKEEKLDEAKKEESDKAKKDKRRRKKRKNKK